MGPRPDGDDDRLSSALRVARAYYLQDRTMDEIAGELGTSRSTVSRLLSHARETGLVEIRVHSPLDRTASAERQILARHGVVAHVVPTPDTISSVDRLDRVAMTAARLLRRYVDSTMTLGVAWGSTVSAVSRHLQAKETHGCLVVQLNGAANDQTTGIEYASEILQRFGAAFSARVQQFPVPAFFDDPATREALWRERSVRRVLDMQARMDVALFGLGSPFAEVPSRVSIGGYLDGADYGSLSEDGVVGDIATVFFREDGSHRGVRLNARWTREFLDHDPRTDLARVTVPVLALTGTKDLQVDPADLDVIAATVPGPVTAHRLPDRTHTLRHQPGPASLRSYREELRRPVDPAVLDAVVTWCSGLVREVGQ